MHCVSKEREPAHGVTYQKAKYAQFDCNVPRTGSYDNRAQIFYSYHTRSR
jgi:hypothetical protein